VPTGVRVALTITTSSFMIEVPSELFGAITTRAGRRSLIYVIGRLQGLDKAQRRAKRPHGLQASPLAGCGMACNHKRVAASGETAYFGGKVTLSPPTMVLRKAWVLRKA